VREHRHVPGDARTRLHVETRKVDLRGERTVTSRVIATDGAARPAPEDPFLAGKSTYWESNGLITCRIVIP
jgi:hypothetical protein